tara:strand:+ start:428 stop:616 length:189 start_codon:yes stop_codon:yes gene_type:complete
VRKINKIVAEVRIDINHGKLLFWDFKRSKKNEKGSNKIKTWLATFLLPKVDPGDTASTKLKG